MLNCVLHGIKNENFIWKFRVLQDVYRSVEEGPDVPILTPITANDAQARLGEGQATMNRPTNDDLEKIETNAIALYKTSCGVAPENFDIIINCEYAKEIWDVLKNLYQGSEQAQVKILLQISMNSLTLKPYLVRAVMTPSRYLTSSSPNFQMLAL